MRAFLRIPLLVVIGPPIGTLAMIAGGSIVSPRNGFSELGYGAVAAFSRDGLSRAMADSGVTA